MEVVACVPGAALGAQHEDGSWDATATVNFGPVKVAFQARVMLDLDDAAMVGRVTARGKDNQRGTRVASSMTFEVKETPPLPSLPPRGGRESTVTMDSQVEITGRLAGVIEGGASVVVGRMAREFAENLARRCAGTGEETV